MAVCENRRKNPNWPAVCALGRWRMEQQWKSEGLGAPCRVAGVRLEVCAGNLKELESSFQRQ